jgi:hypothetical protein
MICASRQSSRSKRPGEQRSFALAVRGKLLHYPLSSKPWIIPLGVLEYVRVPAKAGSVVAFVSDPSHSRRQIWAIGSPKEGSTPRRLFLSWHPVLTVYAYAGQNDPPSWLEDESPQRRHLECLSMTWVNRGIPMLNFETTARCVSLRERQLSPNLFSGEGTSRARY